MKIETLNALLQAKYPGSFARIASDKINGRGHQANRKAKIELAYSVNGKIYTYHSTIQALAERLELIPEVNYEIEAKRILSLLTKDNEVVGYAGCGDTLRWLANTALIDDAEAGQDEYGHNLSKYFYITESKWL